MVASWQSWQIQHVAVVELVWQNFVRSDTMHHSVRPNVWHVSKVFKKSAIVTILHLTFRTENTGMIAGLGKVSRILSEYCGWLKFCGVPIFVVFVEGPFHEFQYPRKSNFQYELLKKILWPQILNPTNVSFLFNPRKLVPTKIKPSTVCFIFVDL